MKPLVRPVADLTRAELERALGKAHALSMALCDEMIAAGRGHERPSETSQLTDPLAQRVNAAAEREQALRDEAARRTRWHGSLHRIVKM